MAKDYKALADTIVKLVGGSDNVVGLAHCMTRLHFSLKNADGANTAELEKTPGVLKVIKTEERYMVIIGLEVNHVYDAIMSNYSIKEKPLGQDKKPGFFAALSDITSGLFAKR